MSIKIVKANYLNKRHAEEIAILMDAYANDAMGGGKPLPEEVKNTLATELSKLPHAFTIISYVDDSAAGLINCFELFSTFACKPLINIHDVVVLENYRGNGLSQRMLKKVEDIAVSKGCCKLTLEVLEGNAVARSSYNKYGFSAYELDPKMGTAVFLQKKIVTYSELP